MTLREALRGWSENDLLNLAVLLGCSADTTGSVADIENEFKWLFHSKSRAKLSHLPVKALSSFSKNKNSTIDIETMVEIPTYDELVIGAAKKLKVYVEDVPLSDLEIYISQEIIVSSLKNMKPKERKLFFEQQLDAQNLVGSSKPLSNNLKGPQTAATLLGIANVSGIGVYLSSTTALGFVTHAAGITLPFAVYSGLTSSIAFIMGPAGWLALSVWGFLNLTKSEWSKIVQGILYIASVNSYKEMNNDSAVQN